MQPLLISVVLLGLAVQLVGEARHKLGLRAGAKLVASASFVILGAARWSGTGLDSWLVAALLLGAVGDLLLLGERSFELGLLAFLADHLCLLVAFNSLLAVSGWSLLPLIPLMVVSAVVLRWLWPNLGRRRIPVAAYVVVIAAMVWGATALAGAGAVPWWVGAAALLFMVSDVTVARHRFVTAAFANRAVGLPMYYAAQVLFALLVGR